MDCSNDYSMVRIICVGAVESARELLQYDNELSNRMAELYVPPMSRDELLRIVHVGLGLMNVELEKKDIENKITTYSNSLASVCHQLCYNMCYESGLIHNPVFCRELKESNLSNAVKSYLGTVSDTFTRNLERACTIPKCKSLLHEIIEREEEYFDPKIDNNGKELSETRTMDREKILNQLAGIEYGEIIRKNQDSKLYSFTNPFFMTFLKMKMTMAKTERESINRGPIFQINELLNNELKFLDYMKIMDSALNVKIVNDEIVNQRISISPYVSISNSLKNDIKRENMENKIKKHNYYKRK
jgi:hypothetical protein